MEFRIADTFTDSLARLTGDEQKSAKTTAFDLQLNPAHPSLKFHKLNKARDKSFWSVRVSTDVRLIVHRTDSSLMLCYVGHHDAAYHWAEQRKIEVHPKTGSAQMVEVRETVQEIVVPLYVQQQQPLFESIAGDDLLAYGVPPEWLPDVRRIADEDSLLKLVDHLPKEAAEALLDLATGGRPSTVPKTAQSIPSADPFNHPDAQRRFRVMSNLEELERALEFPWEKWTIFLHPAQRQLIERDYNGPARVAGSAGTGKTIVALHRAVFLARSHPAGRVLLTTFSETLANSLRTKLRALIYHEPRLGERIEVHALDAIAQRLYSLHFGKALIADRETVRGLIQQAALTVPHHKFSLSFLLSEWEQVVDAWQLETWESYRDVIRLGRKTRLAENQRTVLWQIFAHVRSELSKRSLITQSGIFSHLASHYASGASSPFDFIVVDEAQDIGVAQLRFLAALAGTRPKALFFAGDLGQRIFQQPFSWKTLGVDVRGRSSTLKINYRTSHQIRMQADRLLGPEVTDVDGNAESRKGTVSIFNGPPPSIQTSNTATIERDQVAEWLRARQSDRIAPGEIGIFVRSNDEIPRARAAAEAAALPFLVLDEKMELDPARASISTMHLAKGLEFRSVVVMACDDDVIPLQSRIESVSDQSDLDEVYATERHLLYVACTRARDHLLVIGVSPASEFLADLG
jgi:superfamily I DNA/RNA helicase